MSKFWNSLLIAFTVILVTSCGHNVVTHSRGIGMDLSWDSSNYIPSFRIGSWDVTNTVIKENTDLEASTITNAGLGTDVNTGNSTTTVPGNKAQASTQGGIQIKVKTGPQTNGYVKDVLTSPTLSEYSVQMAKSIYGVQSDLKTTGTKTEVSEDGTLTVEQNTTPIATTTTETVTESKEESGATEVRTTTTVAQIPVKEETQDSVKEATESVTSAVKTEWWYYLAGAIVAIFGGGVVTGWLTNRKKSTTTTADTTSKTSTISPEDQPKNNSSDK